MNEAAANLGAQCRVSQDSVSDNDKTPGLAPGPLRGNKTEHHEDSMYAH